MLFTPVLHAFYCLFMLQYAIKNSFLQPHLQPHLQPQRHKTNKMYK